MNNDGNFGGFSTGGFGEASNAWNGQPENKQNVAQETFVPPMQQPEAPVQPQEVAPAETHEQTASVGAFTQTQPEATVTPVSFEEQFAKITATNGNEGATANVEEVESDAQKDSVSVDEDKIASIENDKKTSTESYYEELKADLAELTKKWEDDPVDVRTMKLMGLTKAVMAKLEEEMRGLSISEKVERNVKATADAVLGNAPKQESDDIHDIEGDPSSVAARFDANTYNEQVDRMRGDGHKMDSKSGVVFTEADTRPFGNN